MDSTTYTRAGITVLSDDGSDGVTAYRVSLRNLAAWANTYGVMYSQGLLSARPAAGKAGRFYRATDDVSGVVYYDDGSTWESVGTSAAVDAAANVGSLRTLGAGSLQAAAGNHTHAGLTSSYVYKTVDTSRSNTTTLTADPHLALTLGNGTWLVDADLVVTGNAGGDFAVSMPFSGTSTTRLGLAMQGPTPTATDTSATSMNVLSTGSSNFGTTNTDGYVRIRTVLVVTGSGSLTVNWAQGSSLGPATTLRAGSHLVAAKLA